MAKTSNQKFDLKGLSFPYKLWHVLNAESEKYISWDANSDIIIMNTNAINAYLRDPNNIFGCKDWDDFSNILLEYNFELVKCYRDPMKGLMVHFRHIHFHKNQPNKLLNILKSMQSKTVEAETANFTPIITTTKTTTTAPTIPIDPTGDLCFMKFGELHKTEFQQIHLYSVIKFQQIQRAIKNDKSKKTDNAVGSKSKQNNTKIKQTSKGVLAPDEPMIQYLDDYKPPYAGYYGDCTVAQVKEFFGKHLPVYGPNNEIIVAPFDEEESTTYNIEKPKNVRKSTTKVIESQNYIPLAGEGGNVNEDADDKDDTSFLAQNLFEMNFDVGKADVAKDEDNDDDSNLRLQETLFGSLNIKPIGQKENAKKIKPKTFHSAEEENMYFLEKLMTNNLDDDMLQRHYGPFEKATISASKEYENKEKMFPKKK